MRVRALVGQQSEIVGPETPIDEVARLMVECHVGAVAVVDRSGIIGICTDRDLTQAVADERGLDTPASECMTPNPDVIDPSVPIVEAAAWMLETGYRHLPVVEDGELLGIVDSRDVLWALIPKSEQA